MASLMRGHWHYTIQKHTSQNLTFHHCSLPITLGLNTKQPNAERRAALFYNTKYRCPTNKSGTYSADQSQSTKIYASANQIQAKPQLGQEHQFSLPVGLGSVRNGACWREPKMVFFRRTSGQFSLQEVRGVLGQGGELQAASRQLYPGHGTEAPSVSDAQ